MNARLNALVEGNHNIPIALVRIPSLLFEEFLPFGAHKDENGVVYFKTDKVNFFVDKSIKNWKGVHKKVTKVYTDEDFDDMKQRILTLPSVFGVAINETHREGRRQIETVIPYMVYINPFHPDNKRQLEEKFAKCEKRLAEGENFSFEINVGEQLKSFLSKRNRYSTYLAYGSTICITNFGRRCGVCYRPWAWFIPITWVLGPPYLCFRSMICHDVILNLKGDVAER